MKYWGSMHTCSSNAWKTRLTLVVPLAVNGTPNTAKHPIKMAQTGMRHNAPWATLLHVGQPVQVNGLLYAYMRKNTRRKCICSKCWCKWGIKFSGQQLFFFFKCYWMFKQPPFLNNCVPLGRFPLTYLFVDITRSKKWSLQSEGNSLLDGWYWNM